MYMNLLKKSVLITATSLIVNSAFALTSTESQVLTQKILASKVIDMPLVAAKLVVAADKADRIETAKAAVVAVAKNHPTALSTVVGAILRKAPEATEAVVGARCIQIREEDLNPACQRLVDRKGGAGIDVAERTPKVEIRCSVRRPNELVECGQQRA
jgi:hypothetical protein